MNDLEFAVMKLVDEYVQSEVAALAANDDNAWQMIQHLKAPDIYNVDASNLKTKVRVYAADEQLKTEQMFGVRTITIGMEDYLGNAIDGLAANWVRSQAYATCQALGAQLKEELRLIGCLDTDRATVTAVHPYGSLKPISEASHALGTLSYYWITGAERVMLYVTAYDFYVSFRCAMCGGESPCGTCHDMSDARRIA